MAAGRGVPPWARVCAALLLCLSEADTRNYYDALGVEPTATHWQIKRAFRTLALKHHPDKKQSAEAEDTFRDIGEAYTVLSNKEKRRLYDDVGHEAFLKNKLSVDAADEEETNLHFSFSDFFQDFVDESFVEEIHIHWSSHEDWEHDDSPYEHYSF